MALIQADRIRGSCSAGGTAAVALTAPTGAFKPFSSVMSIGDTCYYCIADTAGSQWEVGLGTYTATDQLTRTTVFSNSNGNTSLVTFSGGQDIFITYPAQRAVPSARQLVNTMVFNL